MFKKLPLQTKFNLKYQLGSANSVKSVLSDFEQYSKILSYPEVFNHFTYFLNISYFILLPFK